MHRADKLYEGVYKSYYHKVFGYVMNRVKNRADAEDITSEVFMKLFSAAGGFDPAKQGAATYVFRVTQTTLADYFRKTGTPCASIEEMGDIADDNCNYDELLEVLDRALMTVSQRERDIVILHYYHGLSHREIAEKTKLSYTNVRQLCHTAIGKLRREIIRE